MQLVSSAFLLLAITKNWLLLTNAGRPKLHMITYADRFDPRLALPLTTAEHNGFTVVVLGFGHKTGWGPHASSHFNVYRDYIFNSTEPDDVIVMFDAFDVAFVGGASEIIDRYLEIEAREGRELIYNAEQWCSSPRESEYPHFESPWRYLNCGILTGRSRALRGLFKDRLLTPLVDAQGKPLRLQNWHTNWYLEHQDLSMIDTRCELMQVVLNVKDLYVTNQHAETLEVPGALALVVEGNRIRNTLTNSTPPILHFPGHGHWPDWRHPERPGTCTAYEILRALANPDFAELTETEWNTNSFLGKAPWKGICSDTNSWFDTFGVVLSHFGDSVARCWIRLFSWQGLLLVSFVTYGVGHFFYRHGLKRWFLQHRKQ